MGISKDKAIAELEKVRLLNIQINHINRRIADLVSSTSYPSVIYSDLPKAPQGFKTKPHDKFLEKLENLEYEKNKIKCDIDDIIKVFDKLPDKQYKILCLKYVEELSWMEVADKVGHCESYCRQLLNETFMFLEK